MRKKKAATHEARRSSRRRCRTSGTPLRGLRGNPGFTLAVALTLALGIGANAAVFSVLDRMFSPPPGVSEPGRVNRLHVIEHYGGRTNVQPSFGYPEFRELRAVVPQRVLLAGYHNGRMRITNQDVAETGAVFVVGDYFGLLGVRPALGRFFTNDEARMESFAPVAVISHRMWVRDFGRDPNVLRQPLIADSVKYTIIGVAPDNFHGVDMSAADVWVPAGTAEAKSGPFWYEERKGYLTILIRAPRDVDPRSVAALAGPILGRGKSTRDSTAIGLVGDLRQAVSDRGRLGRSVGIPAQIAAVAVIILLIACSNVANLLLARGIRRRREFAIRLVLGVSRGRLIRQLFTETLLLSVLAGAMALVLAVVGTQAMRVGLFPDIRWPNTPLNGRLLALTIFLATLASFGAGLSPALRGTRLDLTTALKGSAGDGAFQRSHLRTALLLLQTALSVVLLAGAGAFVRSLYNVEHVNTGYDIDRLAIAGVDLVRPRDVDQADNVTLSGMSVSLPELIERLRGLRDAENVAITTAPPLGAGMFSDVFVPGFDSLPKVGSHAAGYAYVSPEYLATVGIRVLDGRGITRDDRSGSEPVALVNATMAKALWPGERAIGKCLRLELPHGACRTVVGVVADQRNSGLVEESSMHIFAPFAQARRSYRFTTWIVLRAAPDRLAFALEEMNLELARLAPGRKAVWRDDIRLRRSLG